MTHTHAKGQGQHAEMNSQWHYLYHIHAENVFVTKIEVNSKHPPRDKLALVVRVIEWKRTDGRTDGLTEANALLLC